MTPGLIGKVAAIDYIPTHAEAAYYKSAGPWKEAEAGARQTHPVLLFVRVLGEVKVPDEPVANAGP